MARSIFIARILTPLLVFSLSAGPVPAQAWAEPSRRALGPPREALGPPEAIGPHQEALRPQTDRSSLEDSLVPKPGRAIDLAIGAIRDTLKRSSFQVGPTAGNHYATLLASAGFIEKEMRTGNWGPVRIFGTGDGLIEAQVDRLGLVLRAGSRREGTYLRIFDVPDPLEINERLFRISWGTVQVAAPRADGPQGPAAGLETEKSLPIENSSINWKSPASEEPLPSRIFYNPASLILTITLDSRAKPPKDQPPLIWVERAASTEPQWLTLQIEVESTSTALRADGPPGPGAGLEENAASDFSRPEFHGVYPGLNLEVAALQEQGPRTDQEDSFLVLPLGPLGKPPVAVLNVIADGVGGRPLGEQAGRIALLRLRDILTTDNRFLETVEQVAGSLALPDHLRERLEGVLDAAMQKIHREFAETGTKLGSTLAAVLIVGQRAFVVHVGDSRVYLQRGSRLELLTADDHVRWEDAEEMWAALGREIPEERLNLELAKLAKSSKEGNYLTQRFGTAHTESLLVHITQLVLELGDRFLLVTDGVSDPLEEGEIVRILNRPNRSVQNKVRALLDKAKLEGTDNRTALLVEFGTVLIPETLRRDPPALFEMLVEEALGEWEPQWISRKLPDDTHYLLALVDGTGVNNATGLLFRYRPEEDQAQLFPWLGGQAEEPEVLLLEGRMTQLDPFFQSFTARMAALLLMATQGETLVSNADLVLEGMIAQTQAGLEEDSDEARIRNQALQAFWERQRQRDRRANFIGVQKIRRRKAEQEGRLDVQPAAVPEIEVPKRKFPDFAFNGREWVQALQQRAAELFEKGVVQIPMGVGEVVLLLRGGRQTSYMMIDMMARPDQTKPLHVYLGRFDLNFSLQGGYWATSAQPYGGEKFDRAEAASYMAERSIDYQGVSSMFRKSRSVDKDDAGQAYRALHADHGMAWELRMSSDDVRFALALAAAEVVRYRDLPEKIFGADLKYVENGFFSGLGISPAEVDFETEATWYPLGGIRSALRAHFLGAVRLNGSDWVHQVQQQVGALRGRLLVRIPLEEGEAVLLLRSGAGEALMDMLIQRGEENPRLVGRMDLMHDSGRMLWTARREGSSLNFIGRDALEYLTDRGIGWGEGENIFDQARAEHPGRALWLDEELLQEFHLERTLVRDALMFSVLEVLRAAGIGRWGIDTYLSNSNLDYAPRFVGREKALQGDVVELDLGKSREILRKSLVRSSIRFNPADWVERVLEEGWRLKTNGILEIPIQGGALVVFLRRDRNDEVLLLDLVLREADRGQHVYVGGLDLSFDHDVGVYLAKGPGSWNRFSSNASEYLDANRISSMGTESIFEASRADPANRSALFISSEAKEYNLSLDRMENALLLVALDLLQSLDRTKFGVETGYDNAHLLFMGDDIETHATASGDTIYVYDLERIEQRVTQRLQHATAAGLEEGVITLDQIKEAGSWEKVFGDNNPVVLEIGFLPGWAVLNRAKKEEKNFLANELPFRMQLERFDDMMTGVEPESYPPNVRFLYADVRLLAGLLRERKSLRSLQEIVIDFPPVGEKGGQGSYIFEPPFVLPVLISSLLPGGELILRTESQKVLERVSSVVQKVGNSQSLYISPPKAKADYPLTPQAGRFHLKGVPIYEVSYQHVLAGGMKEFEEVTGNFAVAQRRREEWKLEKKLAKDLGLPSSVTETKHFRLDVGPPGDGSSPMLITHYPSGRQWFHPRVLLTQFDFDLWRGGLRGLLGEKVPFRIPVTRADKSGVGWGEVVYEPPQAGLEEEAEAFKAWLDHRMSEQFTSLPGVSDLVDREEMPDGRIRFRLGPDEDRIDVELRVVKGRLQVTADLYVREEKLAVLSVGFRSGFLNLMDTDVKEAGWQGRWTPELYYLEDRETFTWIPDSTTAGLEEGEIPLARGRVREAIEALTAGRTLQWQVLGPSVVRQFPAVVTVAETIQQLDLDPGGEWSSYLVETLVGQDPPVTRVVYHGFLSDEFERFALLAKRHGLSVVNARMRSGRPSFMELLQQLYFNLTGLSLEQIAEEAGVDLERLQEDLELLEKL